MLEAWQGGDRAAGKELFERYYALLVRFFANKIGGDPMDLVQETFLGCVAGQTRLRDRRNFRSFLFGIAYNQLRKYYERQRAHQERVDPSSDSVADLAPGPSSLLTEGAEQKLLLDALRHIPIEHQVVLELFYWEDLNSAEISEILQQPRGTIRTRLRRARQLLEEAVTSLTRDPKLVESTNGDLEGWAAKIRATLPSK